MGARLAALDTQTGRLRLYQRGRRFAGVECIGRTQFMGWNAEALATGTMRIDAEHTMTVIQNFRNFPGQFCDPEPNSPEAA